MGCGPKKPARDVAAQHKMGPTRGADAAAGHVVSATRARTASCAVKGIRELPRQVPRGPERTDVVNFLRREPSEHCCYICHHGSLLADGL